ncbi:phospholipase D-like protein [Cricetibacter osteomyelitidis]|uniref:Phospholipase D-like protein n=2 Tax=Cricetibacter osteomyelitidis TaxID=1521931 RepID=A0A4R2T3L6_9PAST|nr:phospholipase D-like protein [Cricetibacter osteomyelitidis]
MLDNYWDDSEHSLNTRAPHLGKNCVTPMQDVSSIVTGQVLWDINYNFCQSWDRQNNTQWGTDNIETDLMEQRKRFVRTDYQPNTKLGAEGKLLMAQIVRTYDDPDVEDIMQVYLKNIKQTTSYIYTENQYFRFPPLVSAFIEHWERMRGAGREGPIHWFAITNSSDAGIGKGTKTTNDMLRLLGRQDVMPNVAKAVREEELKWQLKILDIQETKVRNDALNYIPAAKPLLNQNLKTVEEQRQWVRQEMTRIEALKTENADTADTADDNDETKETNLTRELGYELSDNPGIKAHICTLMPKDKTGKYVHTYKKQGKDEPAEVYVHSKVTIMDDVFTFIGSANLNTRSMQLDTELGILTECHESTQALRKRLWGLHTGNNPAANPDKMHDYQVAAKAFSSWQEIININKKIANSYNCALREFLRTDPDISRMD